MANGKKTSPIMVLAVVLIVAIGVQSLGLFNFASILGGSADDAKSGDVVTSSTPLVDFNIVDLHSPQTSATCQVFYRVNGGIVQVDADGQDITASVADSLEWMTNCTSEYNEHGTYVVLPKNTQAVNVKVLDYDSSPSIKVTNFGDGERNSLTAGESLAANMETDTEVEITTSHKDGIKGAAFVLDYLRTNIDDVTSSVGNDLQEPDSLTHNSTAGRAAPDTFASFNLGDLNADPSVNKETKRFIITIDVGTTTYGVANMTYGLIDKDWYRDSDGGMSNGAEEPEENTDVGQAHHLFDGILFTEDSTT